MADVFSASRRTPVGAMLLRRQEQDALLMDVALVDVASAGRVKLAVQFVLGSMDDQRLSAIVFSVNLTLAVPAALTPTIDQVPWRQSSKAADRDGLRNRRWTGPRCIWTLSLPRLYSRVFLHVASVAVAFDV